MWRKLSIAHVLTIRYIAHFLQSSRIIFFRFSRFAGIAVVTFRIDFEVRAELQGHHYNTATCNHEIENLPRGVGKSHHRSGMLKSLKKDAFFKVPNSGVYKVMQI